MSNTAAATLAEQQYQRMANKWRLVSLLSDAKRWVSKDCDAVEMHVDNNVAVTDVFMEGVDEADDEKAATTGEGKEQATTKTAPFPAAATTERGMNETQGRAGEAAQTPALSNNGGLPSTQICPVGAGVNCKRYLERLSRRPTGKRKTDDER